MKNRLRSLLGLALVTVLGLLVAGRQAAEPRWFKGNTHTHTLWSDGDAAPEAAADWYKGHGYHFLVLSDHNILLEGEKWTRIGTGRGDMRPETLKPLLERFGKSVEIRERNGAREMRLKTLEELRAGFEEKDRFIFIQGEEISDALSGKPIHHNVLNHTHLLPPAGGKSVREILERTIRAVEEEAKKCGRPVLVHLNHPNFGWAVEPDDIAHTRGERFFEVYNGHRGVRNYGDRTRKSTEQIWDYVLALRLGRLGGEPLYALATDDAHEYHREQAVSRPGRGWVMVRAAELTADAITKAMLAGDFYASSGVTLESVVADKDSLSVKVAAQPGVGYSIRFIGTRAHGARIGEIGVPLQETSGPAATYVFQGDELYVRAVVVSTRKHPNGYSLGDFETAWTQPVVVRRTPKNPPKAERGKLDPARVEAAVKAGVQFLRARVRKQPAAAEREKDLILLAMFHAGVRRGDPLFDELLKSILEEPLAMTYRVALQAMVLEEVDRVEHQKRIFQCAQFLVDNQCANGQWSYGEATAYPEPAEPDDSDAAPWVGRPNPARKPAVERRLAVRRQREGRDRGDNSNSQYAALGLRAACEAGILIPRETVERAAQAWRDCQHGTPGDPRGWNYGPKGNTPYGSMTAGAVGALVILDHLLGKFWRKDENVNAGMDWLRDHYAVRENPGRHGQHLYYYLYALERACTLYGADRLGKSDWYDEGAKFILDSQGIDGSWEKTGVDTCFAILFLRRATRPLADPRELDERK